MKKLLVLLFLSLSVLAQEIVVKKSQIFTAKDDPYLLSSRFTLSQISNSMSEIEANFAKNSKKISSFSICKGGSYHINPRYKWDKSEKVFLGYEGQISYECVFDDMKKYTKIIDSIAQKDQKLSLGGIYWILSDKQKEQMELKLELESLNFSKEYSAFLSINLKKECKLSKIELSSSNNSHESYARLRASSEIVSPIKESKYMSKTSSYEFVCR
jgi:hypothetical protein